jgi:hypothetical protein
VAYSQPGPAGVDLADAVIRQGLFIDNIVKLGWTDETRFQTAQSHTPLTWSIARYHAFLALTVSDPEVSFIPTTVRVVHYTNAALLTGTALGCRKLDSGSQCPVSFSIGPCVAYTPTQCRPVPDRNIKRAWHDPDPPHRTTRTDQRIRRDVRGMEGPRPIQIGG